MLVELDPSSGFCHGVTDVNRSRDSCRFELIGFAPLE